jgi:putative transposase
VATSWRMDETYIKIKGKWVYLYRAVDKFGDTIDFMLSEHCDEAAATTFFKQAINANGFPNKVVMDKSGVKYLNNLIEQDHRFIKKITNLIMGFKALHSVQATIDGIETAHMIRKG